MASTYQQRWTDRSPEQSRRRAGSILLAIVIHLLILLLLLRLAPLPADHERSGSGLKTFQVAAARTASTASKHTRPVPHQHASAAAATRPKQVYQPSKLHSNESPNADAEAIFALGRGLFKKADIAQIPSASQGQADTAVADAGGGGGEGQQQGPGAGPGGREIVDAEWYREPSEAEMRTYVPRQAAPGNWGSIICQTAPDYRVENCREQGQSPPGIGISRALRQAAFQFKVKPPRVNGKPVMGAWVRIRFYIVDGGMSLHR